MIKDGLYHATMNFITSINELGNGTSYIVAVEPIPADKTKCSSGNNYGNIACQCPGLSK